MALIKCRECGTEISSKAKTCPKCGIRVASKSMGCGTLIGVIFLLTIVIFSYVPRRQQPDRPTDDGYLRASSHLWSGVKLYYGPNKYYVFEVVGGNDNYRSSSGKTIRGLKVRFPNGNEEWKDRNYIIKGENYWVKESDPALREERWHVLEN
jgi:hypothetical protein